MFDESSVLADVTDSPRIQIRRMLCDPFVLHHVPYAHTSFMVNTSKQSKDRGPFGLVWMWQVKVAKVQQNT